MSEQFDKKKYRENRAKGLRGQGDGLVKFIKTADAPAVNLDENGSVIATDRFADPTRLISKRIIADKSFQRYEAVTIHHKPAVLEGDRSQFGETSHERILRQRQSRDARRRAAGLSLRRRR